MSYGLLAEITVNGQYRSGDLARVGPGEVAIDARVLGPDWVQADRLRLYANGRLIRDETISDDEQTALAAGIKWEGQWDLDLPAHDIHLVAIATGPGIDQPYWKTAKPYQSTSPNWTPQVLACSGAVWLDVDGDGRKTSAYDYATRLGAGGDRQLAELVAAMNRYDRSVVVQAAHLYQSSGKSWLAPESQEQLKDANRETQAGVREYVEACEQSACPQGLRHGNLLFNDTNDDAVALAGYENSMLLSTSVLLRENLLLTVSFR